MAVLDQYLIRMKDEGASDLHLSTGRPAMLRLKSEVVRISEKALSHDDLCKILFEIMNKSQIEKAKSNWDVDFAYAIEGVARFRSNVFYNHRGIGAVFRIIPADIIPLEKLNLPPIVTTLSELNKGMVLVTGPTGSGKSTTLASMIDHINTNIGGHIITIEDPIEFVHPPKKALITQREVHNHTKNFANALKAACREDPDIILVGEMRDLETIRLALSAAELGVLVFGTLHTNSASKTVDRIIDTFPEEEQNQIRSMLSESLKGVIAQQLLRTKDGKGRCAAIEVLVGGTALASMIRENKTTQIASMIQTRSGEGMISMDKFLMKLIQEDKITKQEARSKAHDKKLFLEPGEKLDPNEH
ncbi:MAG: type IV pilus twitching motility protein PilT [Bdellovibrionales bacterium]|nr:type IV pilus twitching motility protein PilT [Bdellovibrionales bacterium]